MQAAQLSSNSKIRQLKQGIERNGWNRGVARKKGVVGVFLIPAMLRQRCKCSRLDMKRALHNRVHARDSKFNIIVRVLLKHAPKKRKPAFHRRFVCLHANLQSHHVQQYHAIHCTVQIIRCSAFPKHACVFDILADCFFPPVVMSLCHLLSARISLIL